MFNLIEISDYVRVEPKLFGLSTMEAIKEQLEETYVGQYHKEMGRVVAIVEVFEVDEGVIIPGDGAAHYKTRFEVLAWEPKIHELVCGVVSEVTTFGAFIDMGVMRGMIHISQTMEDFVSFSKSNVLAGKASKRTLKEGDLCLARIVALSHKGDEPKIGLTMRQPGLGKLDWIKEDRTKREIEAEKAMKAEAKKEGKSKKK